MAAPTAVLVMCWPCKQSWEGTVIDCLTAVGCSRISADVFEFDDVEALVQRAAELFSFLPPPQNVLPLPSIRCKTRRGTVCDDWDGPKLRVNKDC
jgi:hypothetical protein